MFRQVEQPNLYAKIHKRYDPAVEEGETIEEECDDEEHQPFAIIGLQVLCAPLDRFVDQQREGDTDAE